jgi:hypothetical protein
MSLLMEDNEASSVAVASHYGTDNRVSILGRAKIALYPLASRQALETTQPSMQWVQGTFSPGREADHLPPPTAVTKNDGAITQLRFIFSWSRA